MKKNKLVIDYEFDFELLGITTTAKGYKLAWDLNQLLDIHLVKQPDMVVGFKNNEEKSFSYYAYETLLNRLKLFRNKPDGELGKYFLVPEFPHFDFILLTQMEERDPESKLLARIKTIPTIQLASNIPLDGLKSKSNFVF